MTKRALCVGLNDYPIEGADLQGCVNDAYAWAKLLTGHYDFASGDVTVVLDRDATKRGILNGLKGLVRGVQKGDVLVFTNSSHGTYLADAAAAGDADEPDRYDEAICPWDTKTNPLRDDELRELFDDLPAGVRLTVISDSCYSGSVTRELNRRPRFLPPSMIGRAERSGPPPRPPRRRSQGSMTEVLLSGCRSDQVSYDAKIGRSFRGAMSYHAQKVIKDAGYKLTYRDLHDALVPALVRARFDQEPQLEGKTANLRRQVFT